MIPKVIHYCWFGKNEKSAAVQKCIESWRKYCPDYEIKEWNEDSFDVECIPFTRDAYKAKKWAFVSDYARLKIIYENGGIYLDTDVELLKSLDDFLHLDGYIGFQKDYLVNTGIGFGAVKGHKMLKALVDDYHVRDFPVNAEECRNVACPIINTEVLKKHGLLPEDKMQVVEDLTIFPREYFDPKDSETYALRITENTYSIHHYDATWKTRNPKLRQLLIKCITLVIGKDNYIKLKKLIK